MKVFKMNDCDHVAAESVEQAKVFYKDQTGFNDEEIENDFEGEVSLEKEMMVLVVDLPMVEQKKRQKTKMYGGELWAYKSFSWVIENENITEPCIICSTEY